ncbi:MAG TPA: tetratricopeptide repeat protein [Ktedonobacterales bacterium]|nr:tetratricopeptide repeat protein [Ktedonobacterales bacterium]
MASNLTNNLIGKLFDTLRDRLMQTPQPWRWILGILIFAMAVFCALLATTVHDTAPKIVIVIGAGLFLLLALMVLIGNSFVGSSQRRLRNIAVESEARAKQLLAEGKLLPIPPLPTEPPQGVSPEELAQIEVAAAQLHKIPWGDRKAYPAKQAPAIFESALAEVNAASRDLAKLHRLAHVFAGLPRPLCHVGAAEVMFRLSYLRGTTYAPVGLRQGLRFATRAQVHTPLQPDALIAQLKLLVACRATYWQELATKTLAMIRQVAPDHPRLALAEMIYHRLRGEYEEALVCADRALGTATNPVEAASLLSSKASLLMSLDRYADAVLTFQNASSLTPSDPWIWHNASIALTHVGRYHEALQCCERALSIMDFGAARAQHERIMESLAQQLGGGAG